MSFNQQILNNTKATQNMFEDSDNSDSEKDNNEAPEK